MKKAIRVAFLILLDISLIIGSYFLSYWIRFEGNIDPFFFGEFWKIVHLIVVIKILVFSYFKFYRSLWEYASTEELINIVFGIGVANAAIVSLCFLMQIRQPRSIFILVGMCELLAIGASRFAYRGIRRFKNHDVLIKSPKKKNVLIVGAGSAGALIIKELKHHPELSSKPVAIVDDNREKRGNSINGVPVIANIEEIPVVVEKFKVDEIIVAIPSASKETIKRIVSTCKETNAKTKILPGVYELIDGRVTVNQIREVDIEDLLGRDPVKLDTEQVESYIEGKTIMVTGCGSIGSELVRQVVRFNPKKIVLVDIYENNAYDLQNELKLKYLIDPAEKPFKLPVYVASVRDRNRMKQIVDDEKPQVIFHAAAHKHVPLMEFSPMEAVKNNIIGTNNMIEVADECGVEKFVLISTDKAVNPTNVMGATKRHCELQIQAYNEVSKTDYVAVRFGNVLGSNGSVIPLFKRQIAAGGPVTVTHEDIIRYFMTIPEAAQLVLQAGAMANGGEIFILDMGEPVRIKELAEDLIRLSGLVPHEEIEIVYTGLRPGEKLYEELLMDEEGLLETSHSKIMVTKTESLDVNHCRKEISNMKSMLNKSRDSDIKTMLRSVIITYNGEK